MKKPLAASVAVAVVPPQIRSKGSVHEAGDALVRQQ